MRGDRWGIEGPPKEAYSRVTNPERFQPLHDAATELLDRLEREFAVERLEGPDADDELGRESLSAWCSAWRRCSSPVEIAWFGPWVPYDTLARCGKLPSDSGFD